VSALFRRLDELATSLTPFVISLVLILLSTAPIYLPAAGPVSPDLGLIAVFFWTVYRLDLMPAVAVLGLGLWQDLLNGAPVGLNAVAFLVVYGVIAFQRAFFRGKPFLVVWWAFGLTAALAGSVFWLAVVAWHLRYVDPTPLVFQWGLTVAVFPFLYYGLSLVHRSITRPAGAG